LNNIEELNAHIYEHGLKGLLPQNLTDNILGRMLLEIDSYEKDDGDTPVSALLMAILTLQNRNIIQDDKDLMEITFEGENELMEKSYKMCIALEAIKRDILVPLSDASSPILKYVFDQKRKLQMSGRD
jgi:hypothetical protein